MAKKQYRDLEGLEIRDIDHQGRGKALYDKRWFLVENALPGEVVDARVVRKDKGTHIARAHTFHKQSSVRIAARCRHFGICGGCKWQNVDYAAQLQFKAKFVADAFKTLPEGSYPEIKPIIGSEKDFYYRNKMEFSFASRKWLTANEMQDQPQSLNGLGLHPAGAFDKVLDLQECLLQPEPSNAIRLWVMRFAEENGYVFFDLRNQVGFLRNLTIRTTTHTGELMVILSVFEENQPMRVKMLDAMLEAFPAITSLHYVINGGKNDVIYECDVIHYHGEPFMREKLGDITFKIGPKSFFQVNIPQAKKLYDITLEMAGLNTDENKNFPAKDHVVYDLYTGIGSIALYAASQCKQVIGIETIAEAIADAEENAKLNSITNCRFLAGDMKDILTADFLNNNPQPDIIITDPPRAGMHPSVVQAILHANAPRIVYVSCNPVTQARDLGPLLEKYKITAVQPVDMFPQTFHVECVVSLERK